MRSDLRLLDRFDAGGRVSLRRRGKASRWRTGARWCLVGTCLQNMPLWGPVVLKQACFSYGVRSQLT